MILTERILRAAAGVRSGHNFTHQQLRLMGVAIPLKRGWYKKLIGRFLADDVYWQVVMIGFRRRQSLFAVDECAELLSNLDEDDQ